MSARVITTRYGADALVRLRDVVGTAKAKDPMAPVTVLVPSNLAGIAARRFLARGVRGGGPGVAGIRFSTILRLAEEVAATSLAPRRPATRPVVAAAWRAVLDEDPGVFGEVASHAATIEALVRAHRELRSVQEEVLTGIARGPRVPADVVRLHRLVVARLVVDWYDETDLLLAASQSVDLGTLVPGTVVLHLPGVLTRPERAFVATLEAEATVTVIAGTTGVRRADREVVEPFGPANPLSSAAEPTAHRVLTASDSDDEVRCIARAVLADLQEVPAHRIAVLYAAEKPYARLLHERFAAAGITVNGRGVQPVAERAVARALLELLALGEAGVPRVELFRALATVSARDFDGRLLPLVSWDRISREAGVVRGDDWTVRLDEYLAQQQAVINTETTKPGDESWRLERARERHAAALALRTFVRRLQQELARGAALTSWRELSTWALELFETLILDPGSTARLPAEEQHAAAALLGALRELGDLDRVEGRSSLRSLHDVLQAQLDAARPRVGTFGTGVLVAPVSDAIGLDVDRVHVVGLAEDLYPGRIGEDPLLPESVRVTSNGELASLRRRLNDRLRALLAALQSGTTVTVSVPRGDLRRSTRRLPSRWLLHTLRTLSGDDSLELSRWDRADLHGAGIDSGSFAGELLSTATLADEQEWRTRSIAATQQSDDPAVLSAWTMLGERAADAFSRFDGDLSHAAQGLPDLLRQDAAISPTALEGYAVCPHAYFVSRLLGVRPLEKPEEVITASAADIGTFMHECLDDLVQAATAAGTLPQDGAAWTREQHALLQEIAHGKAADFVRRGLTGHPRLWAGELERIRTDLARLLVADDVIRAERGASVLASELAFGMNGRPAVAVPVGDGRILMKGSADRVDRGADGTLYVIDLKTGKPDRFDAIKKADDRLVNGTKLQLPVYGYAARDYAAREGLEAGPIRAEYWFVRRKPGRVELPLHEVEEQYAETLGVLAEAMRTGVFPHRPPEKADFRWVQCEYCNPDAIGHGEARERWLRKRTDPRLRDLVQLVEPEGISS